VVDSEPLISSIADEWAQQLGFQYWAYSAWTNPPRERLWSTHNVPYELWSAYVDVQHRDLRADPSRSKMCLLPVLWDLNHLPEPAVPAIEPGDRLLALLHRYRISCGLQLPLFVAGELVATLVLASSGLLSNGARQVMFHQGQSMLAELHALCAPSLRERRHPRHRQTLTSRERECLRWAAMGKTTWEISRVVDISEHTARFHLRNACTKLSASNRQQAIAKAIQLGLLD
jgi:DNA-binding CsgD family transcriptional regulator